MSQFVQQMMSLLTQPPGNLVYHVVLAFSIAGALQSSVSLWQRSGFPQGKRMVIGLLLLLLVQIVQFIVTALVWQGVIPSQAYLPPLDRAISLVSLVVIIWLWLFPEPSRLADFASLLLGLLALVFLAVSIAWWGNQPPSLAYNQSLFDLGATVFALLLIAGSSLLLMARRPNGYGFGLAVFLLLAAGYLAHILIQPADGSFPGLVRLAQMAAFPLLLALPQRFPVAAEPVVSKQAPPVTVSEPRRYGVEPKYAILMLELVADLTPDKLGQNITRMVADVMLSDICLLVSLPDSYGQMVVSVGYSLIQERYIEGFALDGRSMSVLPTALSKGRPLRLPSSSTSNDVSTLARMLKLGRVGHLMAVPIAQPGGEPLMGLILMSPFSNRSWTNADQSLVIRFGESLARILLRMQEARKSQDDLARANRETHSLQDAIEKIRVEKNQFLLQLEDMRQVLEQERSRTEYLAAVVKDYDNLQQRAANQEAEIASLKATSAGVSQEDYRHMEVELKQALEEVSHLKDALYAADQKLLALSASAQTLTGMETMVSEPALARAIKSSSASANTSLEERKIAVGSGDTEAVASLAQELRQPMSSIIGYTDLLLGESVGILGAMQRKFLERVKVSIERMGSLTDDLIQLTAIESGGFELKTQPVDLNIIIDEAVANIMTRLREKNILLRVDVPDSLPQIEADRDALQQVLLHMLQNAGDASPADGEIALHIQLENQDQPPAYILIQVSDSGSGIAAEDLPRVFSRLYRADNPLIEGVGDTGIGLSIVKTLVEAHGGRVWVDTVVGRGSTFSILLPIGASELAAVGVSE